MLSALVACSCEEVAVVRMVGRSRRLLVKAVKRSRYVPDAVAF